MKGSVFRRCYCRDAETGKMLGESCPQRQGKKRHGVYAIRQELPPDTGGGRRSFNRSGFETIKDARDALERVRSLLAIPDSDDTEGLTEIADLLGQIAARKSPLPTVEEIRRRFSAGQTLGGRQTVADWLDEWLKAKRGRQSAISRDEVSIRVYLKPHIGHIRLDRLRVSHLTDMFEAISEANTEISESNTQRRAAIDQLARIPWKGKGNRARRKALKESIAQMEPFRHVNGPATRQRIRSTLRAALNAAIAQQLITFNPASHVSLETGRRPKALVWTEERVEHWQRTGDKPSPVMVWTPEQTGRFLDHAVDDRLYTLFHLIAFRGLRRGEACGQRWTDTNLRSGLLTVARQLVVDGWEVYEDDPKTDAGARTVALDSHTTALLLEHRERQRAEREQWGDAWVETGCVFTQENGAWLHPQTVTRTFLRLSETAELPPVRLHDLRHGAASLAHAAGADLKDIQEMLGHSSIAITADIYTSLLPEVDRAIAEASVQLVPRTRTTGAAGGRARASLAHRVSQDGNRPGPEAEKPASTQVNGV